MDHLNFKITNHLKDGYGKDINCYEIEIFDNDGYCVISFTIHKNSRVYFKFADYRKFNYMQAFATIKYIMKNEILIHIYKEFNLQFLLIHCNNCIHEIRDLFIYLFDTIIDLNYFFKHDDVVYDIAKEKLEL